MNPVELLGTFASVIVAVSLMMRKLLWLRWVNLVGSTLFSAYGLLIQAWPVFGLNAFIVIINALYLLQLARSRDHFSLLEVPSSDAAPTSRTLLSQFLEFYGPDLAKYQPNYPREFPPGARLFFVLRDALPISLFAALPRSDGTLEVLVDYAVPAWRDYRNARFLYSRGVNSVEWAYPPQRLEVTAVTRAYQRYLRKMDYSQRRPGTDRWQRLWPGRATL